MHVLVTGGTGFIGSALVPALLAAGHSVTILSRRAHDDAASVRYVTALAAITEPVDAVINLAGASLAAKRWTTAYKAEMLDSRVGSTRELVAWFGRQDTPPAVLVSGSAIGWYGDSLTAGFTEDSPPGAGFAAELCQQWESAALAAEHLGVRVVLLRLGVVFGRDGGALTEMLRSFRFGVGSWVGSGRQWLSWVHRRDVVESILFLLAKDDASGAFNISAPRPVTHREFAEAAAERKPTLFSAAVPGPLLRVMVGEMAEELLLKGQRVLPERLKAAGYSFRFASLEAALADILGRSSGG